AASLTRQTVPPACWVIVDNGSTDQTPAVVQAIASEWPWVVVRRIEGSAQAARGAPVARAFHVGLEALLDAVDIVVKLDADVSVSPDFADCVITLFERDSRLGVCGATCYERKSGRDWRARRATGLGVRGACRAYRAACLNSIL